MTQVWSDQTVLFHIYLYVLYAASKWQLFPVPATYNCIRNGSPLRITWWSILA